MLEAKNIGYRIKDKWLVQSLACQFEPGKHYTICGPNGAGKSTFLKLLSLELQAVTGEIMLDDAMLTMADAKKLSKQRAVLSQHMDVAFPLTVEEIVSMGRYPFVELNTDSYNRKIIADVMDWVDVTQFANRDYNTLSGGEKQRVQFARVLAQIWDVPAGKTRLLMLDEPVTYLDLKHQFDFLQKVNALRNAQTIIISVLHDLNLVLQYADEVLLMKQGKLFTTGTPQQVLTKENIRDVFEVESHMAEADGRTFLWVG